MNQSTLPTPKLGEQLWGIYFTDREYARIIGDPLRAIVLAPRKIDAEETTPCASRNANWSPRRRKWSGSKFLNKTPQVRGNLAGAVRSGGHA